MTSHSDCVCDSPKRCNLLKRCRREQLKLAAKIAQRKSDNIINLEEYRVTRTDNVSPQ